MLNKLDGYKTYIVALLLGLVTSAEYLQYLDAETGATFKAFLIALGLTTLRDAISKNGSK